MVGEGVEMTRPRMVRVARFAGLKGEILATGG